MNLYDYTTKLVLQKGLSIIPVDRQTKRPIISWKEYQTRLPELEELQEWFLSKTYQDLSIGMITGKISGFVVIDSDDGDEKPFGLETGLMAKTARGYHLYFKYREGIRNKTKINGVEVDIRGEGGYVVFPPSIHASGYVYSWHKRDEAAELPEIFVEENRTKIEKLDYSKVLGASKGSRDEMLYKFLCSMVSRKHTANEIKDAGYMINKTFTPPLPQNEVDTKIKQALKHLEPTKTIKTHTLGSLSDKWSEMKALESIAPKTGIIGLDNIIVGMIPGHLYTLSGDTNTGKTQLATNISYNVARQGKRVLYVALEPDIHIGTTFMSVHRDKPYREIQELKDLKNIEIVLQEDCQTFEDFESLITSRVGDFDLIVIDHISYFINSEANFVQMQSNLLKRLATMTKQKQTAILIIAHPRKTNTGRITMNDIAGSAAFKQDSTEVLIIERKMIEVAPGREEPSDDAIIHVDKKKISSHSKWNYCEIVMPTNKAKVYESDNTKLVESILL